MRIITWNVNGLRSVLSKESWGWIEQSAGDLILLQEIKAKPEQLSADQQSKLAQWEGVWNPAVKPGYSGVLSLSRQRGLAFGKGLGIDSFDNEGRVIYTRFGDVWIFNIYFPNGRNDLTRVPFKMDFYDLLLKRCVEIHRQGGHIILAGDFNTSHRAIDLRNPKANEHATGFLPEERAKIDLYLENGFCDIFRYLYPERVQYTWWAYHSNARSRGTGWRLDYFLISKSLVKRVVDVVIHDQIQGSDHCPVSLDIDLLF